VLALAIAAGPAGASESDVRPPPRLERITIDGLVPYHRAERPITDEQGRIRVIVDLMEEAKDRDLDAARPAIERFDPKRDRHRPQVLLLLDAFGRRHGIEPEFRENERGERERRNITSWVGASVTAYLTEAQIEAIRRDTDVRLVTEDQYGRLSSGPPWFPSWNGIPGGELQDWGWHAVKGKSRLPNSTTKIYVLDSGAAHHDDLGTNVIRRNVGGPYTYQAPGVQAYGPTVGCYSHATHVVSIIAATGNNQKGRSGVYAGVDVVSMTAGEGNLLDPAARCAVGPTVAELGQMLDLVVFENIGSSGAPKMHVVNISMNMNMGTGFSAAGVAEHNQPLIAKAATPTCFSGWGGVCQWYHPGHVVVQSAGNDFAHSCNNPSHAFKSFATANQSYIDGVLVVGALDGNGRPVGGANGLFSAPYPTMTDVPGGFPAFGSSRFGPCIDLWAPGQEIFSLWGDGYYRTRDHLTYSGNLFHGCPYGGCTTPWDPVQPNSTRGWMLLSGTSMAAPHVAAAAAWLADQYGINVPSMIESWLKSYFSVPLHSPWGSPITDVSGTPVRMVRLP
jgi:hypothetical protein